ncbi:MAG: hypothetical protein JWR57_771, partial [Mycetocola sp.]|nr:hypothetical protein [Mycetocola sp.]
SRAAADGVMTVGVSCSVLMIVPVYVRAAVPATRSPVPDEGTQRTGSSCPQHMNRRADRATERDPSRGTRHPLPATRQITRSGRGHAAHRMFLSATDEQTRGRGQEHMNRRAGGVRNRTGLCRPRLGGRHKPVRNCVRAEAQRESSAGKLSGKSSAEELSGTSSAEPHGGRGRTRSTGEKGRYRFADDVARVSPPGEEPDEAPFEGLLVETGEL